MMEGPMTVPFVDTNNERALTALRFGKVDAAEDFDPKIDPMLCFGFPVYYGDPEPTSPVFQIRDKSQPEQRGAEFSFVEGDEKRFLAFVAETISPKARFVMVTPPVESLFEKYIEAALTELGEFGKDDVRLASLTPHRLMMALLVNENYQFTARLSLGGDGKVVRMFLTVDHANCDEPVSFNLECSYVGGHTLDEQEVREEVDRIFGFPPPVPAS
jgi:hypothetical protein